MVGFVVKIVLKFVLVELMNLSGGLFVFVEWNERLRLISKDFLWGVIGLICKVGKLCVVDEVYLRCFDDLLVSFGRVCVF